MADDLFEKFSSQYGVFKKIDAFGYLKHLADNPEAERKRGIDAAAVLRFCLEVDLPIK